MKHECGKPEMIKFGAIRLRTLKCRWILQTLCTFLERVSRTRSDRTGVTLSVRLKVKIYRIWMVGYIGITVTSPRKPWARYTHPFLRNLPSLEQVHLFKSRSGEYNDVGATINENRV